MLPLLMSSSDSHKTPPELKKHGVSSTSPALLRWLPYNDFLESLSLTWLTVMLQADHFVSGSVAFGNIVVF